MFSARIMAQAKGLAIRTEKENNVFRSDYGPSEGASNSDRKRKQGW